MQKYEIEIDKELSPFITKAAYSIADKDLGWSYSTQDNSQIGVFSVHLPVGSDDNTFMDSIIEKAKALKIEWESTEYQRLRAAEYPPIEQYLDAVVKNDEAAIQAYIDACLAVKAKYPKP